MFYSNLNNIFSLLLTEKYVQNKYVVNDFTNLPWQCHNFLFMLEGEGEVITNYATISLKQGDFLFIPKNATYVSKWQAKTVFRSIHFNFAPIVDPLANKNIPIQKIVLDDFSSALNSANTLSLYQHSEDENSFLALSSMFSICHVVFPLVSYKEETNTTSVAPAIEFINKHYREKMTIESLATLCYLSPSRFYYLFKKHTGSSPIAYKNRLCILDACGELVRNKNKTVEELAVEYGFESAVYFRRLFKKTTGKTPTEYKNNSISSP